MSAAVAFMHLVAFKGAFGRAQWLNLAVAAEICRAPGRKASGTYFSAAKERVDDA